jgi:hypothetical protein
LVCKQYEYMHTEETNKASKGFVAFIYGRRSDAGTAFQGPMTGLSRDANDRSN